MYKRQRLDFCEGFMRHFATKCAAVNFVKPWIWDRFSEWRDLSYVGLATWLECPRKYWQGQSCWLNPRNAAQRSYKDQVEWLHLRPYLVRPWCGASRTIQDCWKQWSIVSDLLGQLPPRSSPEKKTLSMRFLTSGIYATAYFTCPERCLFCLPLATARQAFIEIWHFAHAFSLQVFAFHVADSGNPTVFCNDTSQPLVKKDNLFI